ncbi:MAG TPA: hypothetical protein PK397_11685 [Ignavibacteriaceae bacterium]|jgi:hypothetical protein|nr:hypothetical protein [Ignavibacteriaceae bacterium]
MTIEPEITFSYLFKFDSGKEIKFEVKMEKDSLVIIRKQGEVYPDWTKLENFKCPHCPLDETLLDFCPLAINLVEIINNFANHNSYENVNIYVESPNRNYNKYTSLQSGVSSLLGLIMVSSGCPVLGKLKPMLHFHLPFATLEETEIRAFSFYLLAQYIKWKRGESPDWEMNNLSNIYEDIRVLNRNVSRKIADLEEKDTSINSVVVLNNFADYVTFTLDEKMMDELEHFLKEFF